MEKMQLLVFISFFAEFYVLGAVERCVIVLESPRRYR